MPTDTEASNKCTEELDEAGEGKVLDHEVRELAAELENLRPSATTPAMFKLYLILSIGYFCIILQGYDGSLMGGINALPQYLEYYGL
jgi:hypothetical protein